MRQFSFAEPVEAMINVAECDGMRQLSENKYGRRPGNQGVFLLLYLREEVVK